MQEKKGKSQKLSPLAEVAETVQNVLCYPKSVKRRYIIIRLALFRKDILIHHTFTFLPCIISRKGRIYKINVNSLFSLFELEEMIVLISLLYTYDFIGTEHDLVCRNGLFMLFNLYHSGLFQQTINW